MRLQKNTRFALYSVLEFAANPGRQISAAEIAAKYRISPHHLAKVLRDLGRAGLVEAARGVGGGYRFAGNARRLTLMDVIAIYEGTRFGAELDAGAETDVGAAVGVVLEEIDETAKAAFRSITIDTMLKLVERRRRKAD
jgi:Rrf2 family protein